MVMSAGRRADQSCELAKGWAGSQQRVRKHQDSSFRRKKTREVAERSWWSILNKVSEPQEHLQEDPIQQKD